MQSIQEFVSQRIETFTVKQVPHNSNAYRVEDAGREEEWLRGSRHWACAFTVAGRTMDVPFSTGSAFTDEPIAADVLDCLASDSSSIENTDGFEAWAGEFGYDTDSRKAHHTYKNCERQAEELKTLLGQADYDVLLWETERE